MFNFNIDTFESHLSFLLGYSNSAKRKITSSSCRWRQLVEVTYLNVCLVDKFIVAVSFNDCIQKKS